MQFYNLAKSMRAQPGAVIEDSGTDVLGVDVRLYSDENRMMSNSVKQYFDKCVKQGELPTPSFAKFNQ